MIAMLKTRKDHRTGDVWPREIVIQEHNAGLYLEAVMTSPPSAKGRSVDVYVPPEVVTGLLKVLRDEARDVRSRPLEAPHD